MREITEVFPEGSLEFWRDKSEKLIHRVRQLERQLESIYCSFCGERFSLDDTDGINQHIRTCEKHPMRAAEARAERLQAELDKINYVLRGTGFRIANDTRPGFGYVLIGHGVEYVPVDDEVGGMI